LAGDPQSTNTSAADPHLSLWTSRIVLTNTPTAPSTASGVVELPSDNWTSSAQLLTVAIKGLLPGAYRLSALRADGTNVTLGTVALSAADGPDVSESPKSPGNVHQASLIETRSEMKLPDELSASQVRGVAVSGPAGTTVLAGSR
jgi:hypothetical protein